MARTLTLPDGLSLPTEDRQRVVKYVAIRNYLAERITSGDWRPGDQLPSEHDIMARFGVSRITTRQALDLLRAEGWIVAHRGKGYFVSPMMATLGLARLQSFGEMMAPLGLPTRSDVIEITERRPEADIAAALGLDPGEPAIRLIRARIAGGIAVSVDESILPLALGRRLIQLDLARRDIFLLLEDRLNISISHADITLGVTAIGKDLAPLLDLVPGEPVFRMKRVTHGIDGAGLMFEHIHVRLDRLQFSIRAQR